MADGGQLRNIYEDNEHYNKAFLLYDKLGDRIGTMERWCKSGFTTDIMPKLKVKISEEQPLRTLGVGSGSGELESHILKQLLQKFPRIDNHVVEPSAELSGKYKEYVSANTADLKGIDYHWEQLLLEEYQQKREKDGDTSKFHFISAVHSLYYFNDLGKWLDYLYGLLDEGGLLVVMLTSDTSGLGNIMREFPKLGSKSNFGFSDVDISHVRRHFDDAGIAHCDSLIPIRVEMTDCFADNPSPEADLLIDFAAHCIDFRKNSDDQLGDRFLKFLGSDKCTEKRDDGRRYFRGDWGVTVVQ
ncbi:histamine N-methyltransferase-like isoform X1 [Amphiura filiformis]|uniref:histamine N-methyltransferase-like isoform X1 n=1 Tax=Amphiura filiformis TaxID=82378 RepID=UPI003B21E74A